MKLSLREFAVDLSANLQNLFQSSLMKLSLRDLFLLNQAKSPSFLSIFPYEAFFERIRGPDIQLAVHKSFNLPL